VKRILITGGAGFVGSNLALRLRAEWPDCAVVALDNFYRKGSELNVGRLEKGGVTVRTGDVRETQAFGNEPFDLVIDAAAEPSVMAGASGDVRYVLDTNLGGTLNLLEAARNWNARVLFISTSRIYPLAALRAIPLVETETRFEIAANPGMPGLSAQGIAEDFPVGGARTLYGATKFASEIMAQEYAAQWGLKVLINRCGVLAGPWQMGRVDQGVTALWVAAHHYGRPLTYIGYGGKQVRDVLHIDDFADLVIRQIRREAFWDGRVYNVGGGREISFSLRELTRCVSNIVGRQIPMGEDPQIRASDVPLYLTDRRRVMADFEWRPGRNLETLIGDTAKWMRDHEALLRPVFGG